MTAEAWRTPETRSLAHNLVQRINLGDSLTRSAARHPDHEAVVDGPRRMTYREFDEAVNALAHGLSARGYNKGDSLAILSGNSLEFLLTYYACAKSGLVAVPLSLVGASTRSPTCSDTPAPRVWSSRPSWSSP